MQTIKIIIEKHSDGYVAYPIGIKGIVVGEGNTYEEALADVKSAIRFHLETFGRESLEIDGISETFVAEVVV
ncbi:MAG: type II toxin-antitoxin system HicB family antitoxin [Methanothrix sp.]